MTTRPCRSHAGFTLIELLLVMAIIVVLATLAVMVLPTLDRNKGVPNGVTQVQGWVNLSKQQALRDGVPRGIRLIHDGNGRVTTMQYIEQPDPVAPRGQGIYLVVTTPPAPTPQNPNQMPEASLANFNSNPPTPVNWDGVLPGDFLQLDASPFAIAMITGPPVNPATGNIGPTL